MTPPPAKSQGNFVLIMAGVMQPGMDLGNVAEVVSGILSSVTITLPMTGALRASGANLTSEEPVACVKRLASLVQPLKSDKTKLLQ